MSDSSPSVRMCCSWLPGRGEYSPSGGVWQSLLFSGFGFYRLGPGAAIDRHLLRECVRGGREFLYSDASLKRLATLVAAKGPVPRIAGDCAGRLAVLAVGRKSVVGVDLFFRVVP